MIRIVNWSQVKKQNNIAKINMYLSSILSYKKNYCMKSQFIW